MAEQQHDRILGYFLEEANEHLNTIEQGLGKLPETVTQPASIRELFRAAHSIKGSAAMLGLLDVQQLGNQFEANFKLLKEQPQIAVDGRLQSLFIESFSFLRAAINEVKTSKDPYRQQPDAPDPVGDPVFEELKSYLQQLLAQTQIAPVASNGRDRQFSRDPAVEQVFGEYVTRKLTEINHLCLQPDSAEIRTQIQKICQKLGNLGENFEFLEWTNLFTACRLAIVNSQNQLSQLGATIHGAIEQAQRLVLTDRHEEILVTPQLQALIDPQHVNLDRSPDPASRIDRDDATLKLPSASTASTVALPFEPNRPSPVFSSISTSVELFNPDASDNFINLMADSESEFGAEAIDLNELMDSIDGDLPSDGTWLKDDDFFNAASPSHDEDNLVTGHFYQQIFDPSASALSAASIFDLDEKLILSTDTSNYDEETFYTPDFGQEIDDGEIVPNFWSASKLATAESGPLYTDPELPDRQGYQLTPDAAPPIDLDFPAPDFTLDRPMSELFPTVTPDRDWSPLGAPAKITNQSIDSAPTVDRVNVSITNELNSDDWASAASIDLVHSHEFHPDLQTPPIVANSHLVTPVTTKEIESADEDFDLETSFTDEDIDLENLDLSLLSSADMSVNIFNLKSSNLSKESDFDPTIEPTSDVLYLEKLNTIEVPSLTISSLDANEDSSDRNDNLLDQELINCFNELDANDPDIDSFAYDLATLDLEIGDTGADLDVSIDDIFSGLNLDATDRQDLDLNELISADPVNILVTDSRLDRQSFDLDLENSDVELPNQSAPNDFAALDLAFEENNSDLELLDLIASVDELSIANDFTDLDLAVSETNLDVDLLDRIAPVDELSNNSDNNFAELDLAISETNLDIDLLNQSAAVEESSIANDFAALDLEFQENNSDLDLADRIASDEESSIANDFAELDLNILDRNSIDFNLDSSAQFEDLSDLNFNFDGISTGFIDSELPELDLLLADRSESSSIDLSNLDALLGVTALGVGGTLLSGGEFDDLENLISSPAPITTSVANLDDLDRLLTTPAPIVNISPATPEPKSKSSDRRAKQRTFEQTMRVSVRHLDNLNNLVGELVVNRNTLEQDQTRMRQFVEKLLSEVQRLNEVGKRMQDLYERSLMENSLIASRQQSKQNAAPTALPSTSSLQDLDQTGSLMEYDPLEMDRFTPIHLLSQKMIELTVRIRESTADIEFVVDGSTEVTRTLRQITGQLQEDLTKSRMVPFAQTADRLQRGVRDNGLKYGKHVELSVEGRDTLVDKVILESLTDPLIHMVNNAIAHGIESSEIRQSLGKPSEGKITIRALHQGNQTIISISDDGGGINTEQVKAKALEKGIITASQAATMSKNDIYELLFLPSFSTKDQADELAGRGVGMDVVRNSLNEIRGTITTESQIGEGTTFTIRLPLALSIAKALITVNEKVNIAFPMDGIEDTQNVSPEQIQTNSDGEKSIFWRDGMMPFKPLSDLLGFNRPLSRNNFYGAQEDDSDLVSILILRSDGNLIAVQVDKIVSDQEIAIKPLQGPAPKPIGIAGATVLGDGRIVPIADVMELIDLAKGKLIRPVATQWTSQLITPAVQQPESMVLIVDDSITVRELLSLTFKRAGYRVEQARDGQEAWDKLRAGLPCDIVFCDIEMPRMDGLEFLSRIQKDPALKKVPVAMLTSRGSDRHRQIAAQLGASGYFIKPYLEEALLDAAKRMITGEVLAIV